jgi:hypothetical protein
MCVLLCVNSNVRECLEIPLARAYRQTLQLCALCPSGGAETLYQERASQSGTVKNVELDEAAQRRVMKRSAWLQAYCSCRANLAQRGRHLADCHSSSASSRDWPKALEGIAKTWGRLLSFIGLRW